MLISLLAAEALGLSSAFAQAPTLTSADEAAIHTVLDHQIDAWNHHDMKAYVAEMTPDVEWVNVVGMRWRGKDEVYRAH